LRGCARRKPKSFVEAYDGFWHDLAHGTRISGNFGESPRTPKTLIKKGDSEKTNDIKGPKSASQAYDEGSIPFTRSSFIDRSFHSRRARSCGEKQKRGEGLQGRRAARGEARGRVVPLPCRRRAVALAFAACDHFGM
jgi:hypothetical protein